ncbi:hypothetical protein AcV5_008548 [Taiwanofungus camphoratus]|nr:hypothetical protein AcV5_008548 [Antrodia cinnamomea]
MSTVGAPTPPPLLPLPHLPLPPRALSLPHTLTPDPHTPSPRALSRLRTSTPSIQRRARLLAPPAHFAFVAPCPLPFPYRVAPPAESASEAGGGAGGEDEGEGEGEGGGMAHVERWLAAREALAERPCAPCAPCAPGTVPAGDAPPPLRTLYPAPTPERAGPRVLLALAPACVRDCLPRLDVGDAWEVLGASGLAGGEEGEEGEGGGRVAEKAAAAEERERARRAAVRVELVDVLAGHAVLVDPGLEEEAAGSDLDGARAGWAPWALRYSGHQFGTFAGQLGDGRAVSILATPDVWDAGRVWEVQLKGAGRTPFSRFADGLAVERASIREFLCSEAMHALGIATTRALALVSLPEVAVQRERTERACVLARVAASFVRIGSFEALSPPANVAFVGGGQQDAHWDALRVLGEWVGRRVLRLEGVRWRGDGDENGDGDAWGRALVVEVARRNGRMVAGWQAYGFMHGVINSDNVSVLGLTIDYGPFAFMDVFDPFHICNHDDAEGRYAYKLQPTAIIHALRALLAALAPLIGAEAALHHAVPPGWADGVPPDTLDAWRTAGMQSLKDDMEAAAQEACAAQYARLMHKRLALRRHDPADEPTLVRPLLALLADHALDFHGTLRRLALFRPALLAPAAAPALDALVASILALTGDPARLDRARAEGDLRDWLGRYAARIESERAEWEHGADGADGADVDVDVDVDAERRLAARAANPRFVLRQWVLEDVIAQVARDAVRGRRVLAKVLEMATHPFEPWGAEDVPDCDLDAAALDAETRAERRLCAMGEGRWLGWQCSCSS